MANLVLENFDNNSGLKAKLTWTFSHFTLFLILGLCMPVVWLTFPVAIGVVRKKCKIIKKLKRKPNNLGSLWLNPKNILCRMARMAGVNPEDPDERPKQLSRRGSSALWFAQGHPAQGIQCALIWPTTVTEEQILGKPSWHAFGFNDLDSCFHMEKVFKPLFKS